MVCDPSEMSLAKALGWIALRPEQDLHDALSMWQILSAQNEINRQSRLGIRAVET